MVYLLGLAVGITRFVEAFGMYLLAVVGVNLAAGGATALPSAYNA